jgi:hypothetical protein
MASKNTHLLAAEVDGLNKELTKIVINVIDLPHKIPLNLNFEDYQKELAEIYFWFNLRDLEKRIRNCVSTAYFTSSEIRIHILHHILLDIIFNYTIPYKTKLWYQFKGIAEKEGFKGIWKLAKINYEERISYESHGETISGIGRQNINYNDLLAEILNICHVWFHYRYRQIIAFDELKSELYKWGVWAARTLRKRYEFDVNSFFRLLNLR